MDREIQQSGDWIGRLPMHATDDGLFSLVAATFLAADRGRCWRGRWLNALGLGPHEAPWRSVDVAAGVRLQCYDGPREPDAASVLLVPAPIKQDRVPGRGVAASAGGITVRPAGCTDPRI